MILPRHHWQFFEAILLANCPQLAFSFLYYISNALLTCMLAASEISRYGSGRKPLRVSAPKGIQRSSYFLTIPFKYGIPCTLFSGILHWLISQSIYFVRTVSCNNDGSRDPADDKSGVGFSPIGIILALSLAIGMVLAIIALGLGKRYPGGENAVPLISTCSAAISAACHPPSDDTDAHLLPVEWGVVSSENGVGHCSFTTARDVKHPVEGGVYN